MSDSAWYPAVCWCWCFELTNMLWLSHDDETTSHACGRRRGIQGVSGTLVIKDVRSSESHHSSLPVERQGIDSFYLAVGYHVFDESADDEAGVLIVVLSGPWVVSPKRHPTRKYRRFTAASRTSNISEGVSSMPNSLRTSLHADVNTKRLAQLREGP